MKVICGKRRVRYREECHRERPDQRTACRRSYPAGASERVPELAEGSVGWHLAIRNRKASHGQGAKIVDVPGYLASYVLHMTASNTVFLVEAHRHGRK